MKVKVWYESAQEVEVSVSVDDIRAALAETPETVNEAIRLVVAAHQALDAISGDIISKMNVNQRDRLCDALRKQADRFNVPCVGPDSELTP